MKSMRNMTCNMFCRAVRRHQAVVVGNRGLRAHLHLGDAVTAAVHQGRHGQAQLLLHVALAELLLLEAVHPLAVHMPGCLQVAQVGYFEASLQQWHRCSVRNRCCGSSQHEQQEADGEHELDRMCTTLHALSLSTSIQTVLLLICLCMRRLADGLVMQGKVNQP